MQKVACNNGKCWEVKKGKLNFEDLFESHNIVDDIEEDLWKCTFYGS
ncbi:hypothetical protein KY343_01615 [Candidatus Woesearchaeota archaeon]|nr:hypothetical protein [Candidatus Woesearchaeota archaeon]